MRTWQWIVSLVVIVGAIWVFTRPAGLTAMDAIDKGYALAAVQVGAPADWSSQVMSQPSGATALVDASDNQADASPKTVTIVFTLGASAPGHPVVFTLPSGALIANGQSGGQRLVTARPVVVTLSAAQPKATVVVEVYCVDEFKTTPVAATPVSLSPSGDPWAGDPAATDQAGKLIDCIARRDDSHELRQAALWLVLGGFTGQTYADAKNAMSADFKAALQAQADDAQTSGAMKDSLAAAGYRDPRALIGAMTPDMLAASETREADKLAGAMASVSLQTRAMLSGCGLDVGKLAFFNSGGEPANPS